MTVDPRLWKAFDDDHIVDALLGTNGYFVMNGTFLDRHNDTLVIDQLLQWSADRDGWDRAAEGFRKALADVAHSGSLERTYGLVLAYLIVVEDTYEVLPVTAATLRSCLDGVDRAAGFEEGTRLLPLAEATRQRLSSYHPGEVGDGG